MSRSINGLRGRHRRLVSLAMMLAVLTLVAAACGGGDDTNGDTGGTASPDASSDDGDQAEQGTIQIGWIPWEENIANTNLWAEILESEGYDVELNQLEPGVVFDGVASGDLDLFMDVWLPNTHSQYWEEYSEEVDDLGVWFEPATLELTVPQYVADDEGIETMNDLAENPELFDSEITGIEPGAGMMQTLQEDGGVLDTYNMSEDWTVLESSTPAMISSLESAVESEEPIVVTLWSPHPAYGQWDLHRLEDPENAWGEPEELHSIASSSFEEDFPEVHGWIENFEIEEEALSELNAMVNQADDRRAAASEWMDDNEDVWQEWINGGNGMGS